jgi:hypothetical protein
MEPLIWVSGLSVPSVCGATVFVLTRFVKPLIIERMAERREIRTVRTLTDEYINRGFDPKVASQMAREDVFGKPY